MADRLLERLFRAYRIEDREIELGASIGIAMYPEHGTDSETLQRHADAAMYHAKRQGTGCAMYQPHLESSTDPGLARPLRPVSR
jgi:diguanylate cyclase (GGDEF)-like protein